MKKEPIKKPIKRMAEDLLKDSEVSAGMVAVVFAPNGEVKAHGAGIIHEQPELVLFAAAKLVSTVIGDFKPDKGGSLTIDMQSSGDCNMSGEGAANEDPRAVLFMQTNLLLKVCEIIRDSKNLMEEKPAREEPAAEDSNSTDNL